jgi:hypothetical protein
MKHGSASLHRFDPVLLPVARLLMSHHGETLFAKKTVVVLITGFFSVARFHYEFLAFSCLSSLSVCIVRKHGFPD